MGFGRRARLKSRRGQKGYVLLGLLLIFCLLAIGMAAMASNLAFSIKRDREEELIHRGVQYSRAIKLYTKATGNYPFSVNDLYQKYGRRYLRKIYRDPITGQNFKLLHTADIMAATANLQNGARAGTAGNDNGTVNSGVDSNAGPNSVSAAFASQETSDGSTNPSPQTGQIASPGGTPSTNPDHDDPTQGAIFGVVSSSKEKSFREFEHKNHYNQWLFFYDLYHDPGRPFTGPTPLTTPSTSLGLGQSAAGASQQPGFGQSGSSGQQPGALAPPQ